MAVSRALLLVCALAASVEGWSATPRAPVAAPLARSATAAVARPAAAAVRMEEGRLVVVGRCHGEVRTAARGAGGFGYDPHFWVDGRARTFAELTDAQKAARSHRGAAFSSLVACWSDLEGLA